MECYAILYAFPIARWWSITAAAAAAAAVAIRVRRTSRGGGEGGGLQHDRGSYEGHTTYRGHASRGTAVVLLRRGDARSYGEVMSYRTPMGGVL